MRRGCRSLPAELYGDGRIDLLTVTPMAIVTSSRIVRFNQIKGSCLRPECLYKSRPETKDSPLGQPRTSVKTESHRTVPNLITGIDQTSLIAHSIDLALIHRALESITRKETKNRSP